MTSATVEAMVSPQPGRRSRRRIWTGDGTRSLIEPEFPTVPALRLEGTPRKRHYRGIDVARGFALLGMFAVHILPAYNQQDDRATVVWLLFAGTSSALFGVLAGAGLTFTTGGAFPYRGRRMLRAHVQIVLRSIALLAVGFAVNQAPLHTYNILVYFAAAFILAIPFTLMRVRYLALVSAGFMVILPLLRYWIHTHTAHAGYYPNPRLSDLVADPAGVANTLVISGVYPAVTWLAFITVGIGVGRLIVRWPQAPMFLFACGGLAYALIRPLSILIERSSWGYELISSCLPFANEDAVDDFIVFGPTGELPTGCLGWIITGSPHGESPLALLMGATAAVGVIGLSMLLSSKIPGILDPLATIGKIPATLYLSHLVLLAYTPNWTPAWALLVFQIGAAIVFGYLWKLVYRQGPVEWVMSSFAKTARFIVPTHNRDKE